jgi:hypothetical protein
MNLSDFLTIIPKYNINSEEDDSFNLPLDENSNNNLNNNSNKTLNINDIYNLNINVNTEHMIKKLNEEPSYIYSLFCNLYNKTEEHIFIDNDVKENFLSFNKSVISFIDHYKEIKNKELNNTLEQLSNIFSVFYQ